MSKRKNLDPWGRAPCTAPRSANDYYIYSTWRIYRIYWTESCGIVLFPFIFLLFFSVTMSPFCGTTSTLYFGWLCPRVLKPGPGCTIVCALSHLRVMDPYWPFERKTYTWWSHKSSYFWFTQCEYPNKAKEKHMNSIRKVHEKCTLSERPLARNCNPMFLFS